MGRNKSKTPASDNVSARNTPDPQSRNVPSPSFSSFPENVAQSAQHTTQNAPTTTTTTSTGDWTSAMGLVKSDLHRAGISPSHRSKLNPNHRTPAPPPSRRRSRPTTAPATIMTSIDGVPLCSQSNSAQPRVFDARHAPQIWRTTNNTNNNNNKATTNTATTAPVPPLASKPVLPKLNQPLLLANDNTSTSTTTTITKPPTYPTPRRHQPPTDNNNNNNNNIPTATTATTTPPPAAPFDPASYHWCALRDVAFVLDGGFALPPDELCALLRFRYGAADPRMAGLEAEGVVGALYAFGRGRALYETTAAGLIRVQMGRDLRLMREGGVGVVSGDF